MIYMVHKHKIKKLLAFTTLLLALPIFAIAAEAPLVPECARVSGPESECKWEDLVTLIDNIIDYVIITAVPFGTAVIAYAGLIYAKTGIADKKANAKKMLIMVCTGMAVMLGAWIIINTLTGVLLNPEFQEAIPIEK